MNSKQRIIVSITGIFIVLLALVGLTYAYFLTRITGNENDKSISVTTAKLELVYGNDDGSIIGNNEIIEPGKKFTTKTFTVTNNGNAVVDDYAVILEDVSTTYANTFMDGENEIAAGTPTSFKRPEDFKIKITCSSKKQGETSSTECNGMSGTLPLMKSATLDETYITNGILVQNSIEVGEVQTYSVELEYEEAKTNQSADMNKRLEGKFNIIDTKNTVDMTGIVSEYEVGDKVVTNSTRRESQINSDGTYKIIGLEAGIHSIKINETEISKISIKKGETANVGETTYEGVTIPQITITDESRIATIDISNTDINVDTDIETGGGIDFDNPYEEGTLAYEIINNALNVTNEEKSKGYAEFSETPKTIVGDGPSGTNESILTISEDDYDDTYYFRGAVKNNYVNFAGYCWRIVRIEGDGTVKLVLASNINTCDTEGALTEGSAFIGRGIYGDNQIVDSNGNNVYIPNYDNSDLSLSGYNDSMKYKFNVFLNGGSFTQVLQDYAGTETITYTGFSAKDKENIKEESACIGDTGKYYDDEGNECDGMCIGGEGEYTYKYKNYEPHKRIYNDKAPTFKCIGSKTEAAKIYPLTVDEIVYAGGSTETGSNYYLNENATSLLGDYYGWRTISLGVNAGTEYHFAVKKTGEISEPVAIEPINSLRPAISLIKKIKYVSGNGSSTHPYEVE